MHKPFALSLLLFGLGACEASVPLTSAQADGQGKTFPAPSPGQSALYVFREGRFNAGFTITATIGQRTIGQLGADTWFLVEVAPGAHQLRCVTPEATEALQVNIAPGEVRYVQIGARLGWNSPKCAITEVSADVGRAAVLSGRRAQEMQ